MPSKRSAGRSAGGRSSGRRLFVRVRTAKGRKAGSTRWLQRQLNDPYVADARRHGYRSRSAYKLIELDDRVGFLAPGRTVVDLGAAPGGWTQVAVARVDAVSGGTAGGGRRGRVIAVDIDEMEPVEGAEMLTLDVLDPEATEKLEAVTGGKADVVLSDMSAPSTGHRGTDHLRSIALCEAAADFACRVLADGGVLVVKVLQGGAEGELLARLKQDFARVRHVKPPASRDESSETYLVALGFRGGGK